MQTILISFLILIIAALAAALIVTRNALKGAREQLLAGEQEKAVVETAARTAEDARRCAESAMNAAKVSEAGAFARFSESEKALRDYKENAERAARDSASAIQTLSAKLATAEEQALSKQRELDAREKDLAELSQKSRLEFENLANKIFSEKAKEFSGTNETSLKAMLNPLSEKIAEFRNALGETSRSSAKSLAEFSTKFSTEIANMQKMNSELQSDAKGLTTALRGDTQKQGRWGEIVLQKILENSGLENGVTFELQTSYKAGDKTLRPDAVVYLPGNKCIVIDSKVSLTAYDRSVNAVTDTDRAVAMKEYVASLQKHISELSDKGYWNNIGIGKPGTATPEYVLMFVPVESGLGVALQTDQSLFLKAWEKRIIIVSPSTLVATLMTIASIWKQEKQRENVEEIARSGGRLFDKLCGFLEDFKKIDTALKSADNAYGEALKKLYEGKGAAIHQAERLKELGAKTTKELPGLQG